MDSVYLMLIWLEKVLHTYGILSLTLYPLIYYCNCSENVLHSTACHENYSKVVAVWKNSNKLPISGYVSCISDLIEEKKWKKFPSMYA